MTATTTAITTRLYAEEIPAWQRFQTHDVSQLPARGEVDVPAGPTTTTNHTATVPLHPYQRQYSHVYHQRLAAIGSAIWKRIHAERAIATIAVTPGKHRAHGEFGPAAGPSLGTQGRR